MLVRGTCLICNTPLIIDDPEVVPVLRVAAWNWNDANCAQNFSISQADALIVHKSQGSIFSLSTVIFLGNREMLRLIFTRCSRPVVNHLLYFVPFSWGRFIKIGEWELYAKRERGK